MEKTIKSLILNDYKKQLEKVDQLMKSKLPPLASPEKLVALKMLLKDKIEYIETYLLIPGNEE